MITMTEFIEKVDAIMGQQMDDTKANQLCRLYAMIYNRGKNSGIAKACDWLLEWETHQGEDIEVVEQFRKAMKGE